MSVGYNSHQLPPVGPDGLVPAAILGALGGATGNTMSQRKAAALLQAFLVDVCANLADHRAYSVENRAELDDLRWRVHGTPLPEMEHVA